MRTVLLLLLLVFVSHPCFALKPDSIYHITPDSLKLKYEAYSINTPDNATIKLWHIEPTKVPYNGNTIILCYGDAGNMSYWLNQASVLSHAGYSIVLFDYRGFGQSSYFAINHDQLYYNEFATDLISVIQWSKQNVKFKKIGILAFSMGTIMSTIAVQTEKVDFLINEGYVINPETIKDRIFEKKKTEIILPQNSEKYEELIPKINIPMLVFSGTSDGITTLHDSRKIVSQKPNRKLITFKGGHLQGFQKLSKDYFGQVYCEDITKFIANMEKAR